MAGEIWHEWVFRRPAYLNPRVAILQDSEHLIVHPGTVVTLINDEPLRPEVVGVAGFTSSWLKRENFEPIDVYDTWMGLHD